MPRHDLAASAGVGAGAGSFRASVAPGGVLASALSFHQRVGEAGGRARRANSRKRDSFTAVTPAAEGDVAESSWHSADASSAGAGPADGLLLVPELLVTGAQLEKRVGLQILHKKGERFESPWEPVFVGVYAHMLFYYESKAGLPSGVVPLTGATVLPVDRIFRSGDRVEAVVGDGSAIPRRLRAEDCGPCWKITSTAGRVLLFRAPTPDARAEWIEFINQSANAGFVPVSATFGGPARRRSSRAAESPMSSPLWFGADPLMANTSRSRNGSIEVDTEVSAMLRDAMVLVNKQKQEIQELRSQLARQQIETLERQTSSGSDRSVGTPHVLQGSPIVVSAKPPSFSSSIESDPLSLADLGETREKPHGGPVSAPQNSGFDATQTKFLQEQAAAIAEMARNLHREDAESSRLGRSGGSGANKETIAAAPKLGESPGNDFLQQQAIELAEIAKSLQTSFRIDRQQPSSMEGSNSSAPSSTSTLLDSMGQIDSNDGDESILSFVDDPYYLDENGEIERLSEFEASDNHFLEASGFLDSIQQVMKDFIVTTEARRESDHVVINDDVFAEIRQNIDSTDSQENGRIHHDDSSGDTTASKSAHLRQLRSKSSGDYNILDSSRIFSAFSRAQSARDFLSDPSDLPQPVSPKDLGPLLVEENMLVVESVLHTADRDEKMLLLNPLLRIFGSHNLLGHLISWAIDIEVASVLNVATLFRSDDYASRLVSTYSKAVGMDFIRLALSDPIQEILTLQISDIELSPHKDEALNDDAHASSNADNLMRVCQRVIDSIMNHADDIPASYFHICSHLNSKVISRFDGSNDGIAAEDASTLTRAVIGGFLFLRFVCPAITTPHLYGLTDAPAPSETRRILVLVTKLLFKTATSVQFNDREAQLKVLNPFIEKNSPAMQSLFEKLAVVPDADVNACFAADSRGVFTSVADTQLDSDLSMIRSVATKNLDKIEAHMTSAGCPQTVAEHFKATVLSPDVSAHKHAKAKKLMMNMRFLAGFGKRPKKHSFDA